MRLFWTGEIACLEASAKPQFYDLLRRRGQPCFVAFDLLCLTSIRHPMKRRLSAAGRKRIAEAARKRWAALHASQNTATKPATKRARKRRLSPEGRKRIADAAKRRWAAKRAADAAANK